MEKRKISREKVEMGVGREGNTSNIKRHAYLWHTKYFNKIYIHISSLNPKYQKCNSTDSKDIINIICCTKLTWALIPPP